MNLVDVLSCGVRGAKYGTAAVYARGTTTSAAVYADHEGKARRWGTINLDAFGSAQAYVNAAVDVVVYDKSGVQVRTFTEGTSDRCTEVTSATFTGTDYVSAVSAVGEPTTLERVLAMVETSFGTTDFNVAIGTLSVSLQAALSGLAGVYFNVKDIEYGALGDGTTDDTRELQSAIDAASVAGGGIVFLPPGTYLVSQELTVPATVSIIGCGAQISVIKVTADLERALHFTGYAAVGTQRIERVGVRASVAHSASLITAVRGANLTIRSCAFGDVNCTGPLFELQNTNIAGSAIRSSVRIIGTTFTAGGTTASSLAFGRCIASYAAAGTARIDVAECKFIAPVTCTSVRLVLGLCVHLRNCTFDLTASTSGTLYGFSQENETFGSWGSAVDCTFTATGGATLLRAVQAGFTDTDDWFHESGNFSAGNATYFRWFTSALQTTSVGYYCKSTSTRYYAEKAVPGSVSDEIQITFTHLNAHGAIIANNCANASLTSANQPFLSIASRYSMHGDSFTFLGYACPAPLNGTGAADGRTNTSGLAMAEYAVPGVDTTVGTGYFAYTMRAVRAYANTVSFGLVLSTRWYCFGVGGTTKTGFVRKSY